MQIERFHVQEGVLLRLKGMVDEGFPSDAFANTSGVVVLDLAGVKRVTSFGIREWRKGISGMQMSALYFVNVPPCVMAQFGMIANFGGPKGQILSFLAPYRCLSCNAEQDRLFDRRTDTDIMVTDPPIVTCKACNNPMEFDELPDLYRAALSGTAPLAIIPTLFPVLAAGDAAARGLRLTKSVEEAATVLWLSGVLDGRANFRRAADGLEGEVVLVADQLSAVDAAGLAALAGVIGGASQDGCRVWLARCSPPLLDALVRQPDMLGAAALVSIEYTASCPSCRSATPFVVTCGNEPPPALFCPRCGTPCRGEGLAALADKARRLRVAAQPPWLFTLVGNRPSSTPSSVRTPVVDKYSFVRPLGAGGMAEIFLARQQGPAGFDRFVAIKRILPHLAADQAFVQMFLAEARLAARLSHPNIVQIHELLESNGQYYIVMEFVDGWNLGNLLGAMRRTGKQMPAECALRIVANVCSGLHAAHTARNDKGVPLGVIHRDVSPQNVLVGRDGSVKLTDFGIAKASSSMEKTRPGVLKGKIAYLAPEGLSGEDIDARADIFAAGIVLYECLTGLHPFRRASDYRTYQAILSDPLPSVAERWPRLSSDIDAVLARATARSRQGRYQTAEELLLDLEQLIADLGKPATARDVANWVSGIETASETLDSPTIVDEETACERTYPSKPG